MNVRFVKTIDLKQVARILKDCFDKLALTVPELVEELQTRNTIGYVCADSHGSIYGVMIYRLGTHEIHLLHIAVDPTLSVAGRKSVADMLLATLKEKLLSHKRDKATMLVRETFLTTQNLLKAHGFKAEKVLREDWIDTGEDSYLFVLNKTAECVSKNV